MNHQRLKPDDSFPSSSSSIRSDSMNSIRDENLKSLLARKKLHLVLDLDNTLLHSKEIDKLSLYDREYLKQSNGQQLVENRELYRWRGDPDCNNKALEWMTKLRPNVRTFLREAKVLFDLSIFTLGSRSYARKMLDILDPEGTYFANSQVITREDCSTPSQKGLDNVLSHERVTLVIDDIKEVWVNNAKNLIQIAPYEFFDDVALIKKSLSRQWTDESEKHGELARVLRQLKKIHQEFYNMEGQDFESRDVRDVIDEIKRKFMSLGTKQGELSLSVRELVVEVSMLLLKPLSINNRHISHEI